MFFAFVLQLLILRDHMLESSLLTNKTKEYLIEDCYTSIYKGSCHNKCNNLTLSSSFCDVSCKIVRNCCKDFQKVCPVAFEESEVCFQNFLQLFQECDSNGYLFISKCPQDNFLLKKVDADNVTPLENIFKGKGAVNHLFSQVPVTDRNSGFSFKNMSVYLCNVLPGNIPELWDVFIDKFNLGKNGVLSYAEISRVDFAFFPPSQYATYSYLFRCNIDKVNIFDKEHSELSKGASSEFRGFESLCELCYNSNNETVKQTQHGKAHRNRLTFPTRASYKNNKFIFQTENFYSGKDVISWQYIECQNMEYYDENSENGTQCSIVYCNNEFEQTANGQCKILYILHLAVPDDKIPMTKLFLNHLSSYLECYLRNYSGYDVIDEWQVSERILDEDQQRTFFVTPLLLYSDIEVNLLDNPEDAQDYFSNFAQAIHVLTSYRSRLKIDDSEKSTQDVSAKSFTFDQLQFIKFDWTEKHTSIPVCVEFVPQYYLKYPLFNRTNLYCVNVPVHDDEKSKRRGEMDAENNTCLNIFTFSSQRAHSLSAEIFILFYISLVFSILK